MDPSHPDGPWGKWVDGPRPDDDDYAAHKRGVMSTIKLRARPHAKHPGASAKHPMPSHAKMPAPPAQPFGSKGLPTAGQVFHQSLASVDLGAESDAEALMDPSHPSELSFRL